ncbi:HNH endonuclease [Paenibacillus curdlanolyticus YK9]|uniref:HNH endonuclease n=1 Tax=Paenibacillus curdlanolyticus YK9 TaxID=717606 RepID=E0ID66_9BACL|nr:HNH endonuclease [Paenibacillus curdlanolyticus]EFM09521.1 HNH endonuclease [Paenibacillus curdlanolyticus YK9]
MYIWMEPLGFVDAYWSKNRKSVQEIHHYINTFPENVFQRIVKILKLELYYHGKNPYYIVPASIGLIDFKEAYKVFQAENRLLKWPIMPKKLPRTKLSKTVRNPAFKTVYEYEHFIFSDVQYVQNLATRTYELSAQHAQIIYTILEQMKLVPYERLHQYLMDNRAAFPHRNGDIVIACTKSNIDEFKKLAEQSHRNTMESAITLKKQDVPNTQKVSVSSKVRNPNTEQVQREQRSDVLPSGTRQAAVITNPNKDPGFQPIETKISSQQRNKNLVVKPIGTLLPVRVKNTVSRVVRSSSLVRYLRDLYSDACQICGQRIDLGPGGTFSEVHHIQPLGKHRGADVIENMIVVCPNHHIMFDRGAITVDLSNKKVIHANPKNELNGNDIVLKHEIENRYIEYHNLYIYNREVSAPSVVTEILETNGHFGKTMLLIDRSNGEEITIRFEMYHQREFMTGLQRAALYRNVDDVFEFGGYKYKVVNIGL